MIELIMQDHKHIGDKLHILQGGDRSVGAQCIGESLHSLATKLVISKPMQCGYQQVSKGQQSRSTMKGTQEVRQEWVKIKEEEDKSH